MKQFIRYLYEYQDGKRIRNVGFVKVEQAEESTVVHIHGKGLHLAEDKRLKVYIFYVREGQCIGLWQGDIGHVNPAVNFRLAFTPDDTGRMPVDVERMQVFKDEPEPDLASLAARRTVEEQEAYGGGAGGVPGDEGEPSQEVSGEDGQDDLPEEEPGEIPGGISDETLDGTPDAAECPREENGQRPQGEGQQGGDSPLLCIKIQRRDIAQLKRCEWRLANNSFLLHGYYSYHHLLLIQEGEKCWLGVPGIYHPREAQAAEAFGFPRFIRIDGEDVELE